jgi:hypothetical protein
MDRSLTIGLLVAVQFANSALEPESGVEVDLNQVGTAVEKERPC